MTFLESVMYIRMISKIVIIVSLLLILSGIAGVWMKSIRKRMLFLLLTIIGMLGLAFSHVDVYGLLGGMEQLLFRGPAFFLLFLMMSKVCKLNEIREIKELNGICADMPIVYGVWVALSVFVLGMPGTGTFIGMMYALMSTIAASSGVFSYMGIVGIVVGFLVTVAIVSPILREAFLTQKEEVASDKDGITNIKMVDVKKRFIKQGKGITGVGIILVILLLVLSVCQQFVTPYLMKLTDGIL